MQEIINIFSKLLLLAALPPVLTLSFYFIDKRTRFAGLPDIIKQAIFGVGFGLAAVVCTESGVDIGGAAANLSDAAPLCAGLFFGAPAGILAAIIGGIERWYAVAWGIGLYSRLADTLALLFSGLFAAMLKKLLFDDKYPTWGIGLVSGVVMEVIHLTILFITRLGDAQNAFELVRKCTLPMLGACAFSLMLTALAVGFVSKKGRITPVSRKKLSQRVQSRLLITIVLSFAATTLFVYTLETETAEYNAEHMMSLYISDVKADIAAASDEHLLEIAESVAQEINSFGAGEYDLRRLAEKYNISEINIVDGGGIIKNSTDERFLGFDMKSGRQSSEFMILINSPITRYVQEYGEISFGGSDSAEHRKYAGVVLDRGGFVQVGYDSVEFQKDIAESVRNITKNRHVGSEGFMLIADESFNLVSSRAYTDGSNLAVSGIVIDSEKFTPDAVYRDTVYGEASHWMYSETEGYYIVAVMADSEVFGARDIVNYVNAYMEVLVFALLFLLVYLLIKDLVVKNIRSVNLSLSRIISGDLDVKVDVRSSDEFASLSDDINSTVATLKEYIDEAAARIDGELELAKKIQLSTLPSTFPAFPNNREFDIFAAMYTAKEVGGDFYDFYMIGENKLAFTIADVSGKGIPAAMFMMTAKTILKSLAESGLAVNEVLTEANEKLCEENEAGMFVTVWMGILEINTGRVSCSCAGHNPPLIYKSGKVFEYLKLRPGLVLAGMEGVRYKQYEFYLGAGDKLFLYTDGVTEATDKDNTLYGEDRLLSLLNENSGLNAHEMLTETKKSIDSFVGEAEQFDDITMLSINYYGKEYEVIAQRSFEADVDKLAEVTEFAEETLDSVGCSMKVGMQISVALEEIFVNIAHYAYKDLEGGGDVLISILKDGDSVKLRFADSGVRFDPLAKPDPDVSLSADERSVGGLGIYMVKKTMDSVEYEYKDGKNIFTMTKKIK